MLSSLSSCTRHVSRSIVDTLIAKTIRERPDGLLPEHEVWSILGDLGFSISSHAYAPKKADATEVTSKVIADRLVAKGVVRFRKDGTLCTHKTDIGAIQFNIPNTPDGVARAMKVFEDRFGQSSPYELEGTLFVEQKALSNDFGTEMLVSGYQDPFFGPTVCYGFGGTIVEYLKSVMISGQSQLFMPSLFSHPQSYDEALKHLPVARLAEGLVRGTKAHLDHSQLVPALANVRSLISDYSEFNSAGKFVIEELEVNPAVAINKKIWALDGVMRVRERTPGLVLSSTTCNKPLERIRCLTNPTSVIVAGASSKNASNPGSVIISQAKKYGVKEVYALHPSMKSMFGCPAFPNLADIARVRSNAPADLLSVCIPAKSAGALVAEAFKLNSAQAIQVISGGFGETEHGAAMQQQLRDTLFSMPPSTRPVVNGPNTVGNVCEGGINTVFVNAERSNSDWVSGKRNCCLLCQSGAFMLSRISDIAPAVLPRIAISVGNQLDLSVTDFLEYYIDRPDITTYALYMEGLCDGEGIRLMNLVRKAHELGKAVVIYKAGRSQAGLRAAKGHTASMAGDFDMFRNLLELSGALVVDSFEDWNQLVMLTTQFPQLCKKEGRSVGVAVLTNAGFEKCATADHLMQNGLEGIVHLPNWTDATKVQIDKIFKRYKIDEVVDVSEVLDVTPLFPDRAYYELMQVILKDPGCDVAVVGGVPETQSMHTIGDELTHKESFLGYLKKLKEEFPEKAIVTVVESGEKFSPLRNALNRLGLVSFASIDSTSRAIAHVIKQANRP